MSPAPLPQLRPAPDPRLRWVYGVTTVPQRRGSLLPRTLASLKVGGFPAPTLFVDGLHGRDVTSWEREFNLPVVNRYPTIRTYGHWVLTLAEMYIRDPLGTLYAVFQDDFVTYRNLRQYLERFNYPSPYRTGQVRRVDGYVQPGYWNLLTFPSNQRLAPKDDRGRDIVGWYESNQLGRGAVALVFDRPTLVTLLTHQHMVDRPQDAHRGWRAVDGGVVTAMKLAGWKEYVHHPTLVQHTGLVSSMGNRPHPLSVSFQGEDFDALSLVERVGRGL